MSWSSMGAGGTHPTEDAELSKLICTNPGCPYHIQEIPMLGVHWDPRVHPQMWFAQEDFLILKRLCSTGLESEDRLVEKTKTLSKKKKKKKDSEDTQTWVQIYYLFFPVSGTLNQVVGSPCALVSPCVMWRHCKAGSGVK